MEDFLADEAGGFIVGLWNPRIGGNVVRKLLLSIATRFNKFRNVKR